MTHDGCCMQDEPGVPDAAAMEVPTGGRVGQQDQEEIIAPDVYHAGELGFPQRKRRGHYVRERPRLARACRPAAGAARASAGGAAGNSELVTAPEDWRHIVRGKLLRATLGRLVDPCCRRISRSAKVGPFFKIYKEYCRNFDAASAKLRECRENYPAFAMLLDNLREVHQLDCGEEASRRCLRCPPLRTLRRSSVASVVC